MESHLVESCSIFEVFLWNAKFPTFCGVSQLDELYQSSTFKHTKVSMHTVLYFVEICQALNCDQLYWLNYDVLIKCQW
jgi:hypothetical protein